MNKGEAYIYRLGKSELFIAAPNDESHELAFASLGSKAKFDSLLEEWRIPWNDTNPKSDPLDFVQNLKDSVKKLKKPVVIGKIFGYAQITYGEGAESFYRRKARRCGHYLQTGKINPGIYTDVLQKKRADGQNE